MRQGPFLAGLFAVTATTLALEVLDTRLLSVLTWYSLAFLVIAMGLFGITVGAVRVYLQPDRYTGAELPRRLARDALELAIAIPLSYVLLLLLPLRVAFVWTVVVEFVVFAAIIALPFVSAGSVIAAALTRTSFPIGRVYAVDLAGAAVGAPAVPVLLWLTDAGSAIIALGGFAAIASAAFAWSVRDRARARRGLRVAAAIFAVSLLNASTHRGLTPLWVKGRPELRELVEVEDWNSHSRIHVMPMGIAPPALWGPGKGCELPPLPQRLLVIDGDAATPLYHADAGIESLRFLECDVTNLAHFIRGDGAAAVIGVGGSRDIQSALLFGHDRVVGIELNGALLDVLRGPMGQPTRVANNPKVALVHDEARSFLSRTDMRFQLIQASLIDTWAATGAGAHALSENGLYTIEAWSIFLDRLEPGGVFTVSRWSTGETARLVALAAATLIERGAKRAREHIALVDAGRVSTLIVGRDPLTSEDAQRLVEVSKRYGYVIKAAPGMPDAGPHLTKLLDATSREELDRISLHDVLDFRAPTDDRPFFFNVVRLRAFGKDLPGVMAGGLEGNRFATMTLAMSLLASLLLAFGAIALPLWRRARPRGSAGVGLSASLSYFALIGIGFMLAEIGLLQRLSIVLGHPSYSLVVVLASLVAAAGVGSLLSDRLPLDRRPYCYVYPVVLVAVVASLAFVMPAFAPQVAKWQLGARIAYAAGVSTAVGVALGIAFPAGMRIVRRGHDDETPWFWGINGIGGVLASSVALVIGLEWGLNSTFIVSAACYLLLIPAIAVMMRSPAASATD